MVREDDLLTRPFLAGRATFCVRCPSPEIRRAVEELFGDLTPADNSRTELALEATGDGRLSVLVDEELRIGAQPILTAFTSLVTTVTRLALDADPDHLHLHCAAMAFDGRGVLATAPSGTGKTILAAGLAERGWTYTSDEMVAIGRSSTVASFAKPLVIKPGGGELVPSLERARVAFTDADQVRHGDRWWLVPVGAIPAPVTGDVIPTTIVLLQRSPDGDADRPRDATPVHPADTTVALMGQTMDAERFGPDAVIALARIAARCRCVSIPICPLDHIESLLRELTGAPAPDVAVHEVRMDGDAPSGRWVVRDSVRAVLVGDRVVVHDTDGGSIAALDEAGTAIWQSLCGEAPTWMPDGVLDEPSTIAFLEQLAFHGLIEQCGETVP